jgi:L-ascorbate metabolism protein UlaG (beta-lactamase superfamily)
VKNSYKNSFLIIILIVITNFGFSQTNEIKITFIGNAGLHITDGNTNLYVDFPYKSGAHKYMKYDKSILDSIKENSIFLFTHRHSDHYSKKLLKKLNGKKYGNWNVSELVKLNDSIPNFSIQAFKTSHKFTFKHYSYLIIWHNKKIYINGDTGDVEPLSKIKNIDWAFVPYWILQNAKEDSIKIDAKNIGVYHLYPIQQITGTIPDNMIFLKEQNKVILISY